MQELEAATAEAETPLASAETALLEAERRVAEARAALEAASEESHALQVRLTESAGTRRSIVERVEAEWHKPFEQLMETAPMLDLDWRRWRPKPTRVVATLESIGPVNPLAVEEHAEEVKRLEFLTTQRDDLVGARQSLIQAIREIDGTARTMFLETFTAVQANFLKVFQTLFGGGECELRLANPDDPLESEIDIHAAPRGKRTQRIHLLSSGERTLVAVSLLFSIYLTKPSPFCLMDEVDAPLDDANVGRFTRLLDEFKSGHPVPGHHSQSADDAGGRRGVRRDHAGARGVDDRGCPAGGAGARLAWRGPCVGPCFGDRVLSSRGSAATDGSVSEKIPRFARDERRAVTTRGTRTGDPMLIVMRHGAAEEEIQRVVATIEEMGYQARPMPGKQRTTVGLVGNDGRVDGSRLAALPGVQEIIHVTKPYKQVSREWKAESTVVRLPGGLTVGGDEVVVMAGPCSVESERQILERRGRSARPAPTVLRAGAFKPRSSPYSFQGLGRAGLRLLARAREETGPADRHRGDGRRRARPGGRGRRHHPDRRPEHAELFAAQACRPCRKAGPAQAGPVRHHPGAAPLGGIHPGRGEPPRHPLRARRPRLRSPPPATSST